MEKLLQINNIIPIQPSVPTASSGTSSPLSRMQAGDSVSALVSEANGDSLTLTLPDGTQLHASMKAGQALQTQDTLVLQLTSDHGSAPSLRLLSVNAQPVTADIPLLDMALMEMNLPASHTNLSAAALFNRLSLPADAQTFARFATLQSAYPALPAEQAAILAASKIPLDAQNVAAFMQFVEAPAQAADVAAALEAALTPNADAPNGALSGGVTATAFPEQSIATPAAQNTASQENTQAAALPGKAAAPAEAGEPQAAQSALPQEPGAQSPSAQNASVQAQGMQNPAAHSAQEPPANAEATAGGDKLIANALRSLFPKLETEESASMGKALQKVVPALASRIASLTQTAASSSSQGAKEAAQLGAQFVRQMSFGAEMASLYYTQVPFNYKENRSNADLYILKRNQGENGIDADNATIALCLDTPNMGRVESLVQVRAQELSFNFRVETRQIKSVVQEELSALASVEFPAQYRYKGASVSLLESPITPVNAGKVMRDVFGIPENSGVDISI